jgi:glycosyltransferase involved in cell wall biosynthesis
MISPAIYWACHQAGVPVVQTLHNYRLLCSGANLYRGGHVCEQCLTGSLWRGILYGCYRESRAATAAVAAMLGTHRALGTWTDKVNAYIALSSFSRNKFIAGGVPADKIWLKPNFVHPDPGAAAGVGEYALFAGRLCVEKGVRTLLSAWRTLGGSIPLRIVGTGPLETELRQDAGDNVVFTGALPRDQVMSQMRSARFVVCPSEIYENFPMTIAEAYACGVPVLASRLGAMQDVVDDHRTGLLFQAGSARDLAAKAAWAWSQPDKMRQMGKNARSEYVKKYTAAASYRLLMEIYSQFVRADISRAA